MLTRKEREILKAAGRLITRELLAGESVGIHHFGKFYTSEIEVATGMHEPGDGSSPKKKVHVVRFRVWEYLKKQLHAMPTSEPNDRGPHGSLEIIKAVAEMDDIEDEPLPFCPHCGEDFTHLLVNPKTCPGCGLPPEL